MTVNLETTITKLIKDIENLKTQSTMSSDVDIFDALVIAEQLEVGVTLSCADPILADKDVFIDGTQRIGFFEVS